MFNLLHHSNDRDLKMESTSQKRFCPGDCSFSIGQGRVAGFDR